MKSPQLLAIIQLSDKKPKVLPLRSGTTDVCTKGLKTKEPPRSLRRGLFAPCCHLSTFLPYKSLGQSSSKSLSEAGYK